VYDWEWGRAGDFWAGHVYGSVGAMAEAILSYNEGKANSAEYYVRTKYSPEKLIPQLYENIAGRA